ncbi:MAG: c-type cytochrome [Chromatiales bacterium]|nr:c-type cytochrome [Chromatiales bacterium]
MTEQRKAMLAKVQAASYDQIVKDPKMMEFVRSVGKGLFGDNCAACHGRGGQGVVGMYPNLTDDDWLWGGGMDEIHETLVQGREGFMPAFGQVLNPDQLDDVAEYVLTLSNEAKPSEASERGKAIFQGQVGGCYYCHGADAKGVAVAGRGQSDRQDLGDRRRTGAEDRAGQESRAQGPSSPTA